jgi:hypothetical protein
MKATLLASPTMNLAWSEDASGATASDATVYGRRQDRRHPVRLNTGSGVKEGFDSV